MENTAINRANQLAENLATLTVLQHLIEALDYIPEAEFIEALKHISTLSITGEA